MAVDRPSSWASLSPWGQRGLVEATLTTQMQVAQSLARILPLCPHDPRGRGWYVSHCVKGELRHEEMPVKVELRCELTWQATGEPGPDLFSPRLSLPDLRRPPAPSQRGPAPLSHVEPQQVPREAWVSNNSRRPGADPARYQGRRSRAIWPRSCPGGLTFPAPFQRNPTPRAVLSLPQARPARLPPLSTDQNDAGQPHAGPSLSVARTELSTWPCLALGLWGPARGGQPVSQAPRAPTGCSSHRRECSR